MSTNTVTLVPGVNIDKTPSLNEAAYQATQLIRWDLATGLPQKLGGWTKFYSVAIDSPVSCLHAWEDLNAVLHLGVGAFFSLDVITSGTLQNITPQRAVSNPPVSISMNMGNSFADVTDSTGYALNPTNIAVFATPVSAGGLILFGAYEIVLPGSPTYRIGLPSPALATVVNGGAVPVFTTTSGSSTVKVTLANHGLSNGSTASFPVSTTGNGVTIKGFYQVSIVLDANNYFISVAGQANTSSSFSMNGGDAQITYWVAPAASGDETAPTISASDWTLDNFGAYLVACPINGPVFVWDPSSGLLTAQVIRQAPLVNTGIFVSSAAQIIVAYGSSVLDIQDPLLINWCSAGDFTVWTASVTNLAGSFRLSKGSRIVGAMQGAQYAVIWTDLDAWSMAFIGGETVFGFTEIASGCGLIGKFAATVLGTTIYWMSQKQFFALPSGGGVVPIPCTVWDFIFQNLDSANLAEIRAGSNSQFGEVMWWFPVAGGSGTNGAYVKFTPSLSAWDFGFMTRSAWIDQSGLGAPIGADSVTNYLYQHETSNDADGVAMHPSFTTGYWAMSDGEDLSFSDLTMPDMKFGMYGQAQTATVKIFFTYAGYAQSTTYTTPTYTMQSGSPNFINARFRGRLASMTLSSDDLGSWWRLGGLRIRTAPDGRLM